MKKNILFISFMLLQVHLYGQVEYVFASVKNDAKKFLTEYTRPAVEGLMASSSSGWSTSAKLLKTFHVQISASVAGAVISEDKEKFTFNPSDYEYIDIESGPNEIPTVMGGESTTRLQIRIPDIENNVVKVLSFDAPNGIKNNLPKIIPINVIPAPNVQFSMGLPLGFEGTIRYFPKIVSEEGAYIKVMGVAGKHSLTQYFGAKKDKDGKKVKRHFFASLFATYQDIDTGVLDPDNEKTVINLHLHSVSAEFLTSFDYKMLTLYSSIGYTKAESNLKVEGDYNYTYTLLDLDSGDEEGSEETTITDPIMDLYFNQTGIKGTLGVKLNLLLVHVFADVTMQNYPVANVGVAIKL